jgi:hypothetical protein
MAAMFLFHIITNTNNTKVLLLQNGDRVYFIDILSLLEQDVYYQLSIYNLFH